MKKFQTVIAGLVVMLALSAIPAAAQDPTTLRFYIVPKTGCGCAPNDAFRPKYFKELPGVVWSAMDYGKESIFLVAARVTKSQHSEVAANIDVVSFPDNIDDQIALSAIGTLQTQLEGLHIPATTLTTDQTYRDVIGETGRLFQLTQRYAGLTGQKIFTKDVTLNSKIDALPAGADQKILDAGNTLTERYGYSLPPNAVASSKTLRESLLVIANLLPAFFFTGQIF